MFDEILLDMRTKLSIGNWCFIEWCPGLSLEVSFGD